MTQAGELKNIITIKRDTSDGTTDPTWTALYADIRAKKAQASGRLFYAASVSQSENQVVYTIRNRTGIMPTMQLIDSKEPTRPYTIIGEPIDLGQWLEIHCDRTGKNGG